MDVKAVKEERDLQVSTRHEENSPRQATEGLAQELSEREQLVYGTSTLDREPVKDDTV